MAIIRGSSEDIGDAYAPSFNAASIDLERQFGFAPVVKAPLGGKRTLAQAIALGTTGSASDHYKGRGVDIDNHRRYRNANQAAFLYILAAHGWQNIQINGRPFPSEPWHFANHGTGSASPAGWVNDVAAAAAYNNRKKKAMNTGRFIVGFRDTGNYYVFSTDPTLPNAGARYTQIMNGTELEQMVQFLPVAMFATQGEWDVVRMKYGLGDKATQVSTPAGPGVPADLAQALAALDAKIDAVPAAVIVEQKKPGN